MPYPLLMHIGSFVVYEFSLLILLLSQVQLNCLRGGEVTCGPGFHFNWVRMICAAILPASLKEMEKGQSRLSGSESISRNSLVSEPWFIRLLGEEGGRRRKAGKLNSECMRIVIIVLSLYFYLTLPTVKICGRINGEMWSNSSLWYGGKSSTDRDIRKHMQRDQTLAKQEDVFINLST